MIISDQALINRSTKFIRKCQKNFPFIPLSEIHKIALDREIHAKYMAIETAVRFLSMVDDNPIISHEIVKKYYLLRKARIKRLRDEGRHQSIIDITLFEIYTDDKIKAEIAYKNYCKRKTKNWSPSYDDRRCANINFMIKKYGESEGAARYDAMISKQKRSSKRCLEYWIDNGYSQTDSYKMRKVAQTTFSLQKCISKYGEIEGTEVWKTRQNNWQNTLKSKSKDEIEDINRRKSNKIISFDDHSFGTFYCIEIDKDTFKIGITTKRSVIHRYKLCDLENRKWIEFSSTIGTSMLIEQLIKVELSQYGIHRKQAINPFGWTETFKVDGSIIKSLIEYYSQVSFDIMKSKFDHYAISLETGRHLLPNLIQ